MEDDVHPTRWNVDMDNQATDNYAYNAIGQMTRDIKQDIDVTYNHYGLVKEIKQYSGSAYKLLTFTYDEHGALLSKQFYDGSGSADVMIWYANNSSGQEVAMYEEDNNVITLQTNPLYGANLLGQHYEGGTGGKDYKFAIYDHVGGVRAVVYEDGSGDVQVDEYADYYPFGSKMPGRYNTVTGSYGRAYQGEFSKKPDPDNEVGLGHIDGFELRMWDGRLARWTTTDPYGQYHSPYLGMGNNPVSSVDPDGGWSSLASAGVGALVGGAAGYLLAKANGASNNAAVASGFTGAAAGAGAGFGLHAGISSGALGPSIKSAGNALARAGKMVPAIANGVISGLKSMSNANQAFQEFSSSLINSEDYLVFYKKSVYWVNGETNKYSQKYKAYSGRTADQTVKNHGTIPEGNYSVNLKLSHERMASVTPDGSALYSGFGIQSIPWDFQGIWGKFRARLEPAQGTNTYGRNNFYLHGGDGLNTSGCIHCEDDLFNQLIEYRKSHNSIKVRVIYPTKH